MRLQTIQRVPRPVVVAPPAVLLSRSLFCMTCGDWTPHALKWQQDAYVCGCGTQIIYHVNNRPHLWAI